MCSSENPCAEVQIRPQPQRPCAFCRGCHPAELDHCLNLPGCNRD